jgi:stage V sporulation protein B
MARQSFIKGTLILLAAGIINRMLGFIPRIALPRIIGPEGVGLYQMAWPLLMVIITVISGGIPLAVAKLTAEAEAEGNRRKAAAVLRVSLAVAVALSLLFALFCLRFADWIAHHFFTDPRVKLPFLAMAPVMVIIGVSSVLRGYFQGLHDMVPTALSQLTETMLRIVFVLLLSSLLLPKGVHYGAAGAMLGVAAGELGGLVVLLAKWRAERHKADRDRHDHRRAASGIAGRLLKIALPVTGSRLVGSGSYFLESILIVQMLAAAGVAAAASTAQYGILQGMVMPLLLLPTALTMSLAVSLVPSLSEAKQRKDHRTVIKRMHQSLRLSLVTGAPFAVLLYVFAEPVCLLAFGNREAGVMLRMMAPVALFIYFQGPLQAALQALDKPGTALANTAVGATVKLLLIAVLASRPELGITGAIIAINVNIALVTALHWNSISRLLRFSLPAADFLKVGTAAVIAGAAGKATWNALALPAAIGISFAAAAALLAYGLVCLTVGLVDRDDVRRVLAIGRKFRR